MFFRVDFLPNHRPVVHHPANPAGRITQLFCSKMKLPILVAVFLQGSLHAQLPNSVEPSIPDVWKEKPEELKIDLGDLKIGPLGYRIESTDFDKEPDRQLVVILEGDGTGFNIVEVRGRYTTQNEIEEWSLYYHDGSPCLAQLKRWNKISIDGEELGEGLSKVATFLAKGGQFAINGKDESARIVDMTSFAENAKAEQAGAGQPATRSESDSEGGDKPQPESEERSR